MSGNNVSAVTVLEMFISPDPQVQYNSDPLSESGRHEMPSITFGPVDRCVGYAMSNNRPLRLVYESKTHAVELLSVLE